MKEHSLIKLARKSIRVYIEENLVISPPKNLTKEMKEKAGVFVPLFINRRLRGCIGTFEPNHSNVAEETIYNAIASATQDQRFPPVTTAEIDSLQLSIDILSSLVPVESSQELDAKKFGVMIKSGEKVGVMLPDLPDINVPEQ